MIKLYDAKCSDFNNNGIGILRDTLRCEVSEELNGELIVELEYPIKAKYVEYIVNENIIKCDAGLEEEQLFRIKYTKPNLDTITAYGEHISYDLIDNMLEDVFPQNINGPAALDWILSHTQYPHDFTGFSDIMKNASARYVRKNPIEAIVGEIDNSFVKLWGGELERNNFLISMLNRRGSDNGYKIKHRKNLEGLDFTIDDSEIITRIMPQGYNGLFLPEKYVDSPIIEQYPHPKIRLVEFADVKVKESEDDEEGFDTAEEAYEEIRKLCTEQYTVNNIDKPSVNLKVDFVELSKTTEYQKYNFLGRVRMGDTVTVELEYTQVKVRVIKTLYDSLLHRFTKLELGEFKANYIAETKTNIDNEVKKRTEDLEMNILEKARANSTELIKKATTGYVVMRPHENPTEILIMDTNNVNTARKVWRWNMNGFAYSSNGIDGPYNTAMTMDGTIVADFITAGILNADLIKAGTMLANRIRGGTLTLGGGENENGFLEVLDALGNQLVSIGKEGVLLSNGTKLIGNGGLLSNLQFIGYSDGHSNIIGFSELGFYFSYSSEENDKRFVQIFAEIPENFQIEKATITLIHQPRRMYLSSSISSASWRWCYSRNVGIYKGNIDDYYEAPSMEYYEKLPEMEIINNAFGKSDTWQPSEANETVHTNETKITEDIKDALEAGKTNRIIIASDDEPPAATASEYTNNINCETRTRKSICDFKCVADTSNKEEKMKRTIELVVDMQNKTYNTIFLKQMDTTEFKIQLLDSNRVVDLSGQTVDIIFTKPDDTIVQQLATSVDAEKGTAIIPLKEDCVRQAGTAKLEIEVKNTNSEVMSTFLMAVEIEQTSKEKVTSDNTPNYFEEFAKGIDDLKEDRERILQEEAERERKYQEFTETVQDIVDEHKEDVAQEIENFKNNTFASIDTVNGYVGNAYTKKTYDIGDYCIDNNTLYRCIVKITQAEEFDAAKWKKVNLSDEIKKEINTVKASIDTTNEQIGETKTAVQKNATIQKSVVTTQETIAENTDYEIPLDYKVGADVLEIYYMGEKLIKGTHYIEVGNTGAISNIIQFYNWGQSVPVGRTIEFVVRGVYANES